MTDLCRVEVPAFLPATPSRRAHASRQAIAVPDPALALGLGAGQEAAPRPISGLRVGCKLLKNLVLPDFPVG